MTVGNCVQALDEGVRLAFHAEDPFDWFSAEAVMAQHRVRSPVPTHKPTMRGRVIPDDSFDRMTFLTYPKHVMRDK